MNKRVVTFGEIMLRLAPNGYYRFFQNDQLQATILMVTHDAFTASYCKRILFIKDGKIFNELVRGDRSRREFFNRIIEVVTMLGGDNGNVL